MTCEILPFQIVPCALIVRGFSNLAQAIPSRSGRGGSVSGRDTVFRKRRERKREKKKTLPDSNDRPKVAEVEAATQNCNELQRLCVGRASHSLDLPLQHGRVGEAAGVRDDKVPLVPRRVVPHVFFQEVLHKLQLVVPQLVLLHSGREAAGFTLTQRQRANRGGRGAGGF